ncbi:hypothetical protein SUGI_0587810 [Cryptomeria japonica]|nr:hypothetical protein SUGI_0587810 [Cryptomeria japonica]
MGRQMHQQMNHQENRAGEGISSDPVLGKWLNSTGLQHVSASTNLQDCTNYGAQNRSRMFKTSRSVNGTMELYSEPSTPPLYSRSSSQRNMEGGLSPGELSPGIFDLHSVDTELLPEDSISGFNDSSSPLFPVMERDFENDPDVFSSASKKNFNRLRFPSDSSQLQVHATDKDKAGAGAKIKVVVRKRPLNKKEILKKEDDIVTIEPDFSALTVNETKLKVDLTAYVEKHDFVFDAVLDEQVSNDEVYRVTVEPIVPAIFNRTKATCFAYGQTGSGKTYTMQPLPLKASEDILSLMHQVYVNQGFQLYVSFFEIYGGKLYDLLSERRKLCIREDGKQQVCVVGLQEFRVDDVDTVKEFIVKGNAARSTGSTGANEESSRSHAILQLVIKRSADGSESKPARLVGKLSFIDLAGSERGADTTDNDRQTRMEGAEINKSLLALKECIRALDNDQVHIPFRGSKLTEVLRDSFVGNSRTVMISCISPNSGSCEHTLNTLRYADRVKSLSKTSNSKKDMMSMRESSTAPFSHSLSMSMRDSSTVPLSQSLPMSMRESSTAPLMLMKESSTAALTQPSSISMRESSTAPFSQSLSMSTRQSSTVPLTHSLSMSMRQSCTAPLTQPFAMSMRHSSTAPLTQPPSMSMRQSSTAPLPLPPSSVSPLHSHKAPENNNRLDLPSDRNKFGWNKQSDGEGSQHFAMDHGPPIGRDDGQMASLYSDTGKTYNNAHCNGFDSRTAQESQEQDKKITFQSILKGKPDRYQNQNSRDETINKNHNVTGDRRQMEASGVSHTRYKSKDAMDSDMDILDPDEEFNVILKEEEDLMIAHSKQVEDTINIVREEMNLLSEADQPGNHIGIYISKLNDILARKSTGILRLQTRLAQFQKRLNDQNILTCSSREKLG